MTEANPSPEAIALHTRGRDAGQRGELAEALTLLTQAAMLAPGWPNPVYDRAFTHLLMRHSEAALADYERTLQLAPRGFFTASAAVHTLRREQRGELPAGFYVGYLSLEHMDATERNDVVRQLVEKVPSFAPAWLDFAKIADSAEERLRRIDRGLDADADSETHAWLMLNKAMTLQQLGQSAAAEAILKDLANEHSPLAIESWARVLLTQK